jgi:ABC-type nitrate/sulfonate/bicarbonate transport system permease component
MRTAVSLALVVTIAIEMIVGTAVGLGQTIYVAQETYRVPVMYAAILLSAAAGVATNGIFSIASRRWVRWEKLI